MPSITKYEEAKVKKQFLLFLLLITGCASTHKTVGDSKYILRVLHTNDHHGHYLKDQDGQFGMAARKTLIDQLRSDIKSRNGHSLLLSGGDINTGTMESDMFDAEPDFLGMKFIGYDAMAVGNHEFDNKFDVLKQQERWAGFPFLAANIYYKGTRQRPFKAYIVKEIQARRVGILGLTTKDTPFKASNRDAMKLFDFEDIIKAAKETVAILRNKEKVDLIIAVTHVGHHGSATSNGDIDLAKSVAGIDVIVGGHSQELIKAQVHNGTIIVQAEDWGKYVGVLDLCIDKKNQTCGHDYELMPVNLKKKRGADRKLIAKEIKEDPALRTFFSTYKFKADELGKKTVGTLLKGLNGERKVVRTRQAAIGQFMGESLRAQVKGVDAVVINGGSIRSGLPKGEVSRRAIHQVHPYGNTIVTVSFTAQEFFDYMSVVAKYAIVDPKNIIGGYPQIVNMKLTLKDGKLVKLEGKKGQWKIERVGAKIKANKRLFRLGTMNFLAKGGDNYPEITEHKTYSDSGFMINAAMMNYVEAKGELSSVPFEQAAKEVIWSK